MYFHLTKHSGHKFYNTRKLWEKHYRHLYYEKLIVIYHKININDTSFSQGAACLWTSDPRELKEITGKLTCFFDKLDKLPHSNALELNRSPVEGLKRGYYGKYKHDYRTANESDEICCKLTYGTTPDTAVHTL